MHKNFLFILVLLSCVLGLSYEAYAQKRVDHIVAVVGPDIVTSADVNDRMTLILSSSGLPETSDVTARVRPQIISMLIEEMIKTQEWTRQKIDISTEDIDQAMATIAGQNKMTPDQFKTMLKNQKIPMRTLQSQIRAQMGWNRLVMRRLKSQADVRDVDVNAERQRLENLIGQREYLLAEIVLPNDGTAARKLAERLMSDLRQNPARFPSFAQQFSRAAGAAQGGNMGWVSLDQLSTDVADAIKNMDKGSLVGPIQTPFSTVIMFVRDVRTRTADTLPTPDAIRTRLGLERLDRLQKGYFLDLKSSTFVEIRDGSDI